MSPSKMSFDHAQCDLDGDKATHHKKLLCAIGFPRFYWVESLGLKALIEIDLMVVLQLRIEPSPVEAGALGVVAGSGLPPNTQTELRDPLLSQVLFATDPDRTIGP